jgi:triphosphatase
MAETELKFRIPPGAQEGVRRAVATASAQGLRLQARYVDTADGRLAAAGLALRLRREGHDWVQALKSRGDGLMVRGEHEVPLPGRGEPALEPSRHAGTPAGEALRKALGDPPAALVELFATDIRRTRREVRAGAGAVVELALDEGAIHAAGRRLRVCELELELVRGAPSALLALAGRWVQRHGLWLDARSKAQRGERLARGEEPAAPLRAMPPVLRAGMDGAQALDAIVHAALAQALGNACEIADGAGTSEHLHQCRIGLRRLRCALRDFAPLAGEEAAAAARTAGQAIGDLLRRLGAARDLDTLRDSLLPPLRAAGAPALELPAAGSGAEDPGEVLRGRATQSVWLDVLGFLHGRKASAPAAGVPLREAVAAMLSRLQARVARDAARHDSLDDEGRHRARKRLKRLRYGVESCASLFPAKAVEHYLSALRPAQDALGEAHDLCVARALFAAHVQAQPQAWFALGWIAAREPEVQARCGAALGQVRKLPCFWKE